MDELLTNVMVYWTTGSIGSSFMPYYDFTQAGAMRWDSRESKGVDRISAPSSDPCALLDVVRRAMRIE
jgi:hypothetical protein